MFKLLTATRFTTGSRSIYTQAALLEGKKGFFGRIFGKEKKEEPLSELSEAESVPETQIEDQMDLSTESSEFELETANKVPQPSYLPVEQVESELEPLIKELFKGVEDWRNCDISKTEIKEKVAIFSVTTFNKDIDNLSLNNIQSVQDLINFYSTKPEVLAAKHPVAKFFAEMPEENIPPNMKFVPFHKHQRRLHAYN
ncbi:hypothetical protein AYI70_g5166 [Smittium culicis]|uniref:39S ribosomal protein L50, mitochondrial n=1 Tax=Smittium culicis TaxID=133412 RepID=A0A1R1XVW8_9FUNG|nr:hypothetical protein AYI70_g11644 [Smittium culicis]OMJ18756.1 hypothetical protein AYI70_g5166 [Smittium culicis]